MFKVLVSDVAGTIVSDDGVVLRCFEQAVQSVAPERWDLEGESMRQYAADTMGQSKGAVFQAMLKDQTLAERANEEFDRFYRELLSDVHPIPGVEEVFQKLRAADVRIVLNTGFTRPTLDALVTKMGWDDLVDASVTPAEAGEGRPSPAMIGHSMRLVAVDLSSEVAVVGDTVSDVESGRAAGAGLVISVLTGAHSREVLEGAGPDHIVESIVDVPELLGV